MSKAVTLSTSGPICDLPKKCPPRPLARPTLPQAGGCLDAPLELTLLCGKTANNVLTMLTRTLMSASHFRLKK